MDRNGVRAKTSGVSGASASPQPHGRWLNLLSSIASLLALAGPFIGAGTLAWPMAWLYIVLVLGGSVVSRLFMLRAHPELAAERAAFVGNAGVKGWDRVLVPLIVAGPGVTALIAGLDRRFGWPPEVNSVVQALSVIVLLACLAFASWAMTSNPFFSSVVRIQAERDHRAVDAGPYRFVRHPAYAGTIPAQFAVALILGSLWALVPAALVVALMVLRTALEDRTLLAELPGYREYAGRVRYRLLPGVW